MSSFIALSDDLTPEAEARKLATVDLNLRQLRYLVAVVDEGHFGRAAAKLLITPPALTQQIRKLEREVGFALLDRDRHPVIPTPSGQRFLHEVRTLVDSGLRAAAIARCEARRQQHRFDLGFVVTPLGRLTRPVLDVFAAELGPEVLRLVELSFGDQTAAVLDGRVDAAFVWGPADEPRLRIERALAAPRVLAVARSHPLSRRTSVQIAEIRDEVFVQLGHDLVSEAWSRWWSVDPRPDGSPVRYGPVVHTIAEFLEEVATGRAVAITSELLGDSNARPDVCLVPIDDVAWSEVLLCTRPNDPSPMVDLLRRVVAQSIRSTAT